MLTVNCSGAWMHWLLICQLTNVNSKHDDESVISFAVIGYWTNWKFDLTTWFVPIHFVAIMA